MEIWGYGVMIRVKWCIETVDAQYTLRGSEDKGFGLYIWVCRHALFYAKERAWRLIIILCPRGIIVLLYHSPVSINHVLWDHLKLILIN